MAPDKVQLKEWKQNLKVFFLKSDQDSRSDTTDSLQEMFWAEEHVKHKVNENSKMQNGHFLAIGNIL